MTSGEPVSAGGQGRPAGQGGRRRIGFYVRAFVLFTILLGICLAVAESSVFRFLRECHAAIAAGIASQSGVPAVAHGTKVEVAGVAVGFEVTPVCAGLYSFPGVLAILWAVRQSLRRRVLLSVALVALLLLVNGLRIASFVGFTGSSMATFAVLHDWVWPLLSGFLLAGLLVTCSRWDAKGHLRVAPRPAAST